MAISLSLGLLILRLFAGLTLAAHGAQKLFGWFEGPGFARMQKGFQAQGLKPSLLWTCLVVLGEVGGGLSIALGFLTALGAAGVVATMFMATMKAHWKNGFWSSNRGMEFSLTLLTIGLAIGLTGPGSYALDVLFGIALPSPLVFVILTIIGIIVDIIGLVISRPAPSSAGTPSSAS